MAYLDTNTRTTKPTSNDKFETLGRFPALFGVFVAFVKAADDVQRNGRLRVWIPEFGTSPEEEQGWLTVNYCSPFSGATNEQSTSQSDIKSFDGTQTSYGMWMVPPDVNVQVLVMFAGGDPARGFWIGSVYDQFMNNMIPGTPADSENWQYPGKDVPVAEYNKWDKKVTQPDRAYHPVNTTKFQGVGNQGLITDPVRGTTTSGARREAPSKVFGILTPGPEINPAAAPADIRRKGGSSLIMDDGTGTEHAEIATKSGAKIRIDETNGFVYLINRDGTAWVQMDKEGNIDIFGATNISMRAQRDINLRADRNINIEAGQNIFMKAAKDTTETTTSFTYDVNNLPEPATIPYWQYVGENNGDGGNIVMQSLNNWHSTAKNTAYLTVTDNNMNINIGGALAVQTKEGGMDFSSKMGIKMTTDAAFDLASSGDIRIGSKGKLSVVSDKDMAFCTNSSSSLNATEDIVLTAGNVVSIDGISLEIGTNVKMENLDAVAIKAESTQSGTMKSNTVVFDNSPIGGGGPASPQSPTTTAPVSTDPAMSAGPSAPAEIKPLNDKINILATWNDPATKFKRNSEPLKTTASKLPTYEPCPEHKSFNLSQISGTNVVLDEADRTYNGSSAPGNNATTAPPPSTVPGANNTQVAGDPVSNDSFSKDLNLAALKCQLILHEGVEYKIYVDTMNLLHGGIGHLLRDNEIPQFPIGTPISQDQVDQWYTEDSASAIKIAQVLMGDVWSSLSDIRKRAVCDLAFNLGQPRLSKFVNFIKAMKAKDFNVAAVELKNSVWYAQVGRRRGNNIATMIAQGVDPTCCNLKYPG